MSFNGLNTSLNGSIALAVLHWTVLNVEVLGPLSFDNPAQVHFGLVNNGVNRAFLIRLDTEPHVPKKFQALDQFSDRPLLVVQSFLRNRDGESVFLLVILDSHNFNFAHAQSRWITFI